MGSRRIFQLSLATIAWLIVSIMFLASLAGAVNTWSCTGHEDEIAHKKFKKTATYTNFWFDYKYTNQGQRHNLYEDGATWAWHLAAMQRNQYQIHFIICHGFDGNELELGSTQEETMWGGHYGGLIKRGGHPGFKYSAMPWGVVLIDSCESFEDPGEHPIDIISFKEDFIEGMDASIYIGLYKKPRVSSMWLFGYLFSMYTRYYNYYSSWIWAYYITYALYDHDFRSGIRTHNHGGLDHSPKLDRYNRIERVEEHENDVLDKNTWYSMIYKRPSHYFNSNGAFFIFQGVIDNDWDDFLSTGEIKIDIDYKCCGQWKDYSFDTYEVRNRQFTNYGTEKNGGADICSRYIDADTMKYDVGHQGEVRIKIKYIPDDPSSQSIKCRRFEIMEAFM